MTLSDLFLFASASVGMTLIVVYGGIFARIREAVGKAAERFRFARILWELLSCVQCTGFWSGVFCGLYFSHNIFYLFLCGCAASVLSMLVDKYLMFLHRVGAG